MVSVSSPANSVSDNVIPVFSRLGPHGVCVDVTFGGLGQIVGRQEQRDIAVDDDAADRQAEALQLFDGFDRLLDRQRLQQRHQMDCGLLGVQELDHALALRMHRTALGQIGDGLGDVEEPRNPSGRRRIDHDGVVNGQLVADRSGPPTP